MYVLRHPLKNVCQITAVVQLLSRVQLFVTPWTATHQPSLSFTVSQNLPKFMSTESVMLSNHLIFCCLPLLLLPSTFPSNYGLFQQVALRIRWPNYWSFNISPSNEYLGLISFRLVWSPCNPRDSQESVFIINLIWSGSVTRSVMSYCLWPP